MGRHSEIRVYDIKVEAASVNTGSGMKNDKLKSKDFFDVKNDPDITFHADKAVPTGLNTFDVPGTFTIRGVSKPETLVLTVSGEGCATQNSTQRLSTQCNAFDHRVGAAQLYILNIADFKGVPAG